MSTLWDPQLKNLEEECKRQHFWSPVSLQGEGSHPSVCRSTLDESPRSRVHIYWVKMGVTPVPPLPRGKLFKLWACLLTYKMR
jgi:hypothetical protein